MTKNLSNLESPLSKRIRIDYDDKISLSENGSQSKNVEARSPYDTDESSVASNSEVKKMKKKKKTKDWFKKVTPHVTSTELPLDLFNDEGDEEEESEEEEGEEEEEGNQNVIVKTEPEETSPMNAEEMMSNFEKEIKNGDLSLDMPIKQEFEIKKEPDDENINLWENDDLTASSSTVESLIGAPSPAVNSGSIVPVSEYEEERILMHLESSPHLLSKNLFARQLRRKLKVRRLQRERGLPVFDLDETILRIAKENNLLDDAIIKEEVDTPESIRVLDRYLAHPNIHSATNVRSSASFKMKLVGRDEYSKAINSPFTGRILKPYIRRDYESRPLKLKLLNEILKRGKNNSESYPIDYCYVQPHHIPAINSLAEKFFWPGIDLSECLQYPDFSCVVLYRRIVIAFAFLIPDVSHTEAYISFIFTHPEWRRAGIAKFMLYHLIQTCMGKDIILHVSANNPAILLYQKFGFKVEEYIVDFYDKYYPPNSNECKHALFLRLSRY